MNFATSLVAASAMALCLAACNSPPEEAEGQGMATGAPAPAAPAAVPGEVLPGDAASPAVIDPAVPGATPTPGDMPTTGATASPSPAASAAAAAPKPAVVAQAPAAFAICSACHSVKAGENGLGPSLAGVFGRKAGNVAGFDYSAPMMASGLTWNAATLDRYLESPMTVVPGTKMAFAGVKDAGQRKAVIDYLKGL